MNPCPGFISNFTFRGGSSKMSDFGTACIPISHPIRPWWRTIPESPRLGGLCFFNILRVALRLALHDSWESLLGDGRLNAKIRDCQTRKIPYMLVVGEREAASPHEDCRIRRLYGKQGQYPGFSE
jgi:hypothetical protein